MLRRLMDYDAGNRCYRSYRRQNMGKIAEKDLIHIKSLEIAGLELPSAVAADVLR